jgi:hypothetical protein
MWPGLSISEIREYSPHFAPLNAGYSAGEISHATAIRVKRASPGIISETVRRSRLEAGRIGQND